MEQTQLLHRALDQCERVVKGINSDQMSAPTPCTEFDVTALLNHTVASVRGLAQAARGEKWDMSGYAEDHLGGDPAASFVKAAGELRAATPDESSLERDWAMPFGDSPGSRAIAVGIMEVAQHAWDLARATGQPTDFDDHLSEAALELARQNMPPDDKRSPEAFGPSVAVADDAPAHDRLAAFMGRQP